MQSELAGGMWEWRGNDKSGRLWINPRERWSKWRQNETCLSDTGSKIIQVDVKPHFSQKSRDCKTFRFCSTCIAFSKSSYNSPVYKKRIYEALSN